MTATVGPARPGRPVAARGHADRHAPSVAGRAALAPRRGGTRARGDGASCGSCWPRRERPFVHPGRRRLDAAARRRPRALRRGQRAAGRGALPPPGPARQRPSAATPATSAIGAEPEAGRAHQGSRPPDRDRRAPRRDDDAGLHAARRPRAARRRSCTSITSPEELGRVYQADLAILAGIGAFATRAGGAAAAPSAGPGPRRTRPRRHADYLAWREPDADRRARCRWARSWPGCASRLPDDAIVTNGAGNYSGWVQPLLRLPRLPHPARPDLGLDGLRPAGGGRGQARPPEPHGRLLRRRRLLPDDRPGAGDRRPVRAAAHRHRRRTTACTARSACTRSASTRRA